MERAAYVLMFGKFVLTAAAAMLALFFVPGNPLYWGIVIGAASTLVTWLVSDYLMYPRFGSITASFVDGILGVAVFALTSYLVPALRANNTIYLIYLFIVGFGGFVLRQYLVRNRMMRKAPEVY
ncbi:MAG: DUF2512 family protein [Desulfotomaculum sp.]|nr:DUF2512 family protein [Desulfotomaculum sp.]